MPGDYPPTWLRSDAPPYSSNLVFCHIHGYSCNHRRSIPPIPYSQEIRDKLLSDPEFIKGIKEGMAAMKEGKTTPWSEVKKELGIE